MFNGKKPGIEITKDTPVPTLASNKELVKFIDNLAASATDEETAVYATSLAAATVFMHMANAFGLDRRQCSIADMDLIRRLRLLDGPFTLIPAEKLLYPQTSDLRAELEACLQKWLPWAAAEARALLLTSVNVNPALVAHWRKLARAGERQEQTH